MIEAACRVRISFVSCAIVALFSSGLGAADPQQEPGKRSLAGQVCPAGSFVTGFDAEGDIMCSPTCGNGVLNTGETCDDGNTQAGDGCSSSCENETAAAPEAATVTAAAAGAAGGSPAEPALAGTAAGLAISKVEPSSVVYGKRELAVTILGSGFDAGLLIEFAGKTYTPKVNPQGTRAEVTLGTRNLALGAYAITVSNPSGERTTLKKALVVY